MAGLMVLRASGSGSGLGCGLWVASHGVNSVFGEICQLPDDVEPRWWWI